MEIIFLWTGLTLFSVWKIDEMEMTFKAAFTLEVKWFDSRLTFINLKPNNSQVSLNKTKSVHLKKLKRKNFTSKKNKKIVEVKLIITQLIKFNPRWYFAYWAKFLGVPKGEAKGWKTGLRVTFLDFRILIFWSFYFFVLGQIWSVDFWSVHLCPFS